MRPPLKWRYVPLIALTLIAFALMVYSLGAYSTSYATLHDFQVYVENVNVTLAANVKVNVTFALYNPSSLQLRLTYIEEEVLLNGTNVPIEKPYISRYDTGGDYIRLLPAHANSTISILGQVEEADFPSGYDPKANNAWSFSVVVSLENVPLVTVATLWRSVVFQASSVQ